MMHFEIFLLFLVPINVQSVNRRRPPELIKKYTKPYKLPDYTNIDFVNQVKIPNESFCNKMALKGADLYMVMPWWHHYCEGLNDKNSKKSRFANPSNHRMLKNFQNVLDKLQEYKRKEKTWKAIAAEYRPVKPKIYRL